MTIPLEAVLLLIPFLVMIIVGIAKMLGLSTRHAPHLVAALAIVAALVLINFYETDFKTALAGVEASLAAAGLYSMGKRIVNWNNDV